MSHRYTPGHDSPYDIVADMMGEGYSAVEIAKMLGLSVRYVQSLERQEMHIPPSVLAEWDRMRKMVKHGLRKEGRKRARKEHDGDVVFYRVTAGSGYWWQCGFSFDRFDGSGTKGR